MSTLNPLSRLKGIETLLDPLPRCCWHHSSESTFPFEGNWNFGLSFGSLGSTGLLWIHFPVWRELKLFTAGNCKCFFVWLWIHFPVWRELKLCQVGIWLSHLWTLNPLSRLKGIETTLLVRLGRTHSSLNPLSRLKGIETRSLFNPCSKCVLWIHFPVWRELKQGFFH